MRDGARLLQRREAAKALVGLDVRNMAPATKDVLQLLGTRRKAVAVVAEVPSDRPGEALRVGSIDLSALAFDGDENGLVAVAQQKPPVVYLAPCVSREAVWAARLAGASAIVVPAAATDEERAAADDAARRTHMLAILEVADASEVAIAQAASPRAVLLADVAWAADFPAPCVAIARVSTPEAARALRGVADAALLAPEMSLETDFENLVTELEA